MGEHLEGRVTVGSPRRVDQGRDVSCHVVARREEVGEHRDGEMALVGHRVQRLGDGGRGDLEEGGVDGSPGTSGQLRAQFEVHLVGGVRARLPWAMITMAVGLGTAGKLTPVSDEVGVGPHAAPWPDDPRLDPELLAQGDRRNVVDRYRYWRHEAIVEDLDVRRHPFHVAIENWAHDFNIGTVVRNANAFLAAEVHIVGNRRWNRRGAMVTDRYQHVRHHPTIEEMVSWAESEGLPIWGIDNLAGAVPIESAELPTTSGAAVRTGGSGSVGAGACRGGAGVVDQPVRLDPIDQRRRRIGDRDAHVDPTTRGVTEAVEDQLRSTTRRRRSRTGGL